MDNQPIPSNQPPDTQPVYVQPPVLEDHKKEKTNFAGVFMIILLLAVLTTAGYYVYKNGLIPEKLNMFRSADTSPVAATETADAPVVADRPEIKPTPVSVGPIPLLPTEGWKTVENMGVTFMIPQEASCNDENDCTTVTWTTDNQGQQVKNRLDIEIEAYIGGLPKVQFYANHKSDCREIESENNFGKINAMQIAVDPAICTDGGGGIFTILANRLVIFPDLSYDGDGVIRRWDIRDTVISTLKIKKKMLSLFCN